MIDLLAKVLVTVIPAIGVAIGQGRASKSALIATNIQPTSSHEISKALIIGLALIETSSVLGLAITIFFLNTSINTGNSLGLIILASIGFFVGLHSAIPLEKGFLAVSKQPFMTKNIINLIYIGLSFLLTPAIFAFILMLMMMNKQETSSINEQLKFVSSALSIFLGSMGGIWAIANFNGQACTMTGYNRQASKKIFNFTFVSQTMIETPILISFIVSLIINNTTIKTGTQALGVVAAGICMGICGLVSGYASGNVALTGVENLGKKPELAAQISKISLLSQGFLDTFAIYGLLISILILILK
jgi:F0F1-type ATP synthase membrane subunit c/vacuolar-type H+-ATPase subunit K